MVTFYSILFHLGLCIYNHTFSPHLEYRTQKTSHFDIFINVYFFYIPVQVCMCEFFFFFLNSFAFFSWIARTSAEPPAKYYWGTKKKKRPQRKNQGRGRRRANWGGVHLQRQKQQNSEERRARIGLLSIGILNRGGRSCCTPSGEAKHFCSVDLSGGTPTATKIGFSQARLCNPKVFCWSPTERQNARSDRRVGAGLVVVARGGGTGEKQSQQVLAKTRRRGGGASARWEPRPLCPRQLDAAAAAAPTEFSHLV